MNLDEVAATYRLLALEGCDGAGKSTLAAALHARHGYSVIHSPRTPDHIDLGVR
jgi:thymidylate kinase